MIEHRYQHGRHRFELAAVFQARMSNPMDTIGRSEQSTRPKLITSCVIRIRDIR